MTKYKKTESVPEQVIEQVEKTVKRVDAVVEPVRKTALERFPTTFLLLVTVGVTAVFTGIEALFLQVPVFTAHPELVLIIGVLILLLTGTLYKKLK